MSLSPSPGATPGAITVVPSSLDAAAASIGSMAGDVHARLPAPLTAEVIGDAHCHAALSGASGLVGQALDATAGALGELARALSSAAGAYGLADVLALPPERG